MKIVLFAFVALFALAPLFADETKPRAGRNVTPDEAEKILKESKSVVVLDVRTPEEFKSGHIAGAKNVDFRAADFAQQVAALDKSKSYVVHCAAGGRSGKALPIIKAEKFTGTIYHLNGGFQAWEGAGKPVER